MTDFYKILKSETKKDTSNNVFIGLEDTNINNEYRKKKHLNLVLMYIKMICKNKFMLFNFISYLLIQYVC